MVPTPANETVGLFTSVNGEFVPETSSICPNCSREVSEVKRVSLCCKSLFSSTKTPPQIAGGLEAAGQDLQNSKNLAQRNKGSGGTYNPIWCFSFKISVC